MLHRPFRHARGRLADRREAGLPEAEVVALEVGCRLWILQDRLPHCELTPGLAVGFDASRSRALVRAPRMTDFGIEMISGSSSITADTHRGCTGLSRSLGVGSYVSPIRGIGLWCSPDRRVQELGVWRARKCV